MENKRIIITTIDKIQEINVVEALKKIKKREDPNFGREPNLHKNYGFNAGGNLVKTPCTPIHQWFYPAFATLQPGPSKEN